jgi:uncharacterized protein
MMMPKAEYEVFEALNPFFEVVMEGLRGLVDGDQYFDTIAEDASFEFRYRFPGWPLTIRGRANLMASFSGYGKTIKLHSGDALVVHRSQDSRVVILEYEVHGKILSGGAPYESRAQGVRKHNVGLAGAWQPWFVIDMAKLRKAVQGDGFPLCRDPLDCIASVESLDMFG